MKNNNIIRFAQSLFLLPFVTGTVSLGGIEILNSNATSEAIKAVFEEKQNMIGVSGTIVFNQAMDQKKLDLDARLDLARQAKARAIDDYFKEYDMPLHGMGEKMVLEAEKNGIDWRLLPAIAVIESTGGKFACKGATHSFFGWGSCKINFKSKEQAIEIVAMNLGGNNPNTDHHYAGKTVKEILEAYNPPSIVPNYAKKVMKVMSVIGPEEIDTAITLAKS